jgi:hypothetical protein
MPEKDTTRQVEKNDQTVEVIKSSPPWRLITIGVFATVVIAAVFIGGALFIRAHRVDDQLGRPGLMNHRMIGQRGEGMMNHGGFWRSGTMQAPVARGVVTAVNGDTITVSGLGKQVTVKKSSSTTISGDKSDVAVNDTVTVYGTTNPDNSISATRISVNNEIGGRAMSSDNLDDTLPSDLE